MYYFIYVYRKDVNVAIDNQATEIFKIIGENESGDYGDYK